MSNILTKIVHTAEEYFTHDLNSTTFDFILSVDLETLKGLHVYPYRQIMQGKNLLTKG